jgi:hypothetical protein
MEKLPNEALHIYYSSRNVITTYKSRQMACVNDAVCMREIRNTCKISVRKPEKKSSLGDLGLGVKLFLKWILKK